MSLDEVLHRTPRRVERPPTTAVVARIDEDGTWVSVPGTDPRQPIGPCRGGSRRAGGDVVPPLELGTSVLLIWTDDGPWVAAVDTNAEGA